MRFVLLYKEETDEDSMHCEFYDIKDYVVWVWLCARSSLQTRKYIILPVQGGCEKCGFS